MNHKRLIAFLAVLSVVFGGCAVMDKQEPASSGNSAKSGNTALLENLIANGRLERNARGWSLKKKAEYDDSFSRSVTDRGSIKIRGDGSAGYKIADVPKGKYQLRYFLQDIGDVKSAEMELLINGKNVQKIPCAGRGYWLEYVSEPINITKNSEISILLTVKGSGIKVSLDEVQLLKIPGDTPELVTGKNPVSALKKRSDGNYYIEYRGKPAIFNFTHAYADGNTYSLDEMVKKIKEAGYSGFIPAISWGFSWREIQNSLGETPNFDKLDTILAAAEKYDMFVDLQWYGIGYGPACSKAPDYILENHGFHSKKPDGSCDTYTLGGDYHPCIAKFNLQTTLNQEKAVLKQFIDYVAQKDVNRRIVGIEIECEATEAVYNAHEVRLEEIAAHIDELAKIVKESAHAMIVHVNHGYGMAPHFLFNTSYIDFNGSDPYGKNLAVTKQLVSSRFDSRIPHIMENGGFDNITSHIAQTIAAGGFLCMYPVAENDYNGIHGVYGPNMKVEPRTLKITALNTGISGCEQILASAPISSITAFNLETNTPSEKYSASKRTGDFNIMLESKDKSAPVGIAVSKDNAVYCFADSDGYFSVYSDSASGSLGKLDAKGEWMEERGLQLEKRGDRQRTEYTAGTVIRFTK